MITAMVWGIDQFFTGKCLIIILKNQCYFGACFYREIPEYLLRITTT